MSSFNVGDKVRIRADASQETDSAFIDAMKDTPGTCGVVSFVEDAIVGVLFDNGDDWWYHKRSVEAA